MTPRQTPESRTESSRTPSATLSRKLKSRRSAKRQSDRPFYTYRILADPTRSPAWRWDRAFIHLIDDLTFSADRDDETTGQAITFRKALGACRTPEQKESLRKSESAMFAAYELYDSDSRKRYEVEARLLAKQSPPEVAQIVGLHKDVVQLYAVVFFHVIDFFSATDWIMGRAIGLGPYSEMTVPELGRFLKAVAFNAGPVVLDALLSTVVNDDGLFKTHMDADLSTTEGRNAARMTLLVMAHFERLRRELVEEMGRIRDLIRRFECESAAERRDSDDIEHALEQLEQPSAPDAPSCRPRSGGEFDDPVETESSGSVDKAA